MYFDACAAIDTYRDFARRDRLTDTNIVDGTPVSFSYCSILFSMYQLDLLIDVKFASGIGGTLLCLSTVYSVLRRK